MKYKLLSLNVGRPEIYKTDRGELKSAYRKAPVTESTFLSTLNFTGDEQADKKNHGGPDKAVCLYPAQHYRHWEEEYSQTFPFPSFGENLTVEGIEEGQACIGDIYQAGTAILQVSQPRKPCYIIARTHGIEDFPARVTKKGYTGFYLRVLREGKVTPGDLLELTEAHPARVTIQDVNEILYNYRNNTELIKRVLAVNELAEGLRVSIQKRL